MTVVQILLIMKIDWKRKNIYDAEFAIQQRIKPVLQELNNYFDERVDIDRNH